MKENIEIQNKIIEPVDKYIYLGHRSKHKFKNQKFKNQSVRNMYFITNNGETEHNDPYRKQSKVSIDYIVHKGQWN